MLGRARLSKWVRRTALLTTLTAALAVLGVATVSAAPPNVNPGTAVVDGSESEWNTSTAGPDFFAPMCDGWDCDKHPTKANLFLRYDCNINPQTSKGTLYILVQVAPGYTFTPTGDQWVSEGTVNDKVLDKTDGNDGVPPDYEELTDGTGWEGSVPLDVGSFSMAFHATVNGSTAGTQDKLIPVVTTGCTTAVHLESFKAVARAKSVKLKWRTATELGVVGFNVWRGRSRHKLTDKLNGELIAVADPGMISGHRYVYKDKKAKPGKRYFYRLEIVGINGALEMSEIVKVRKPPSKK